METIIELGKVDYNNSGRKNCMVDVEVSLKDTDKGKVFTASGDIWNPKHTDIYTGGQILDEIGKFFPLNKQLRRIITIWKKYHLNNMHAGCEHQRDYEKEPYGKHAKEVCHICNYEYGSGWQFESIPEETIAEIEELLKEYN